MEVVFVAQLHFFLKRYFLRLSKFGALDLKFPILIFVFVLSSREAIF